VFRNAEADRRFAGDLGGESDASRPGPRAWRSEIRDARRAVAERDAGTLVWPPPAGTREKPEVSIKIAFVVRWSDDDDEGKG
jgi:hypothetical protein